MKSLRSSVLICAMFTLAACGGGGGFSTPASTLTFTTAAAADEGASLAVTGPFIFLDKLAGLQTVFFDFVEDRGTCASGTAAFSNETESSTTISFTDCVYNGSTYNGSIAVTGFSSSRSGNNFSGQYQFDVDLEVNASGTVVSCRGTGSFSGNGSDDGTNYASTGTFSSPRFVVGIDEGTITFHSANFTTDNEYDDTTGDDFYSYDYAMRTSVSADGQTEVVRFSSPQELTYDLRTGNRTGKALISGANNSFVEVTMSGNGNTASYQADGDGNGSIERTGTTTVEYEDEYFF